MKLNKNLIENVLNDYPGQNQIWAILDEKMGFGIFFESKEQKYYYMCRVKEVADKLLLQVINTFTHYQNGEYATEMIKLNENFAKELSCQTISVRNILDEVSDNILISNGYCKEGDSLVKRLN